MKLFNNGEDEKLLYDAFKIIADYMGWEVFTDSGFSNYYRKNTIHGHRHEGRCLSLDVMAIIWDKLRTAPRFYLAIGDTIGLGATFLYTTKITVLRLSVWERIQKQNLVR